MTCALFLGHIFYVCSYGTYLVFSHVSYIDNPLCRGGVMCGFYACVKRENYTNIVVVCHHCALFGIHHVTLNN